MGFLGDFVGGAADAGAGIIGNQIKSDAELERQKAIAQMNNDLEIARQQTIQANTLKAQNENAESQRVLKVNNINTAAQPIIDSQIQKNAEDFYKDGDAHPVGEMADEEKARFTPNDSQRNMALAQGSVNAGYTDPAVLAGLSNKSDIAQGRLDSMMDKTAMLQQHYALLDQARNATSAAQAELLKAKAEELKKLIDNPPEAASEKVSTRLAKVNATIDSIVNSGGATIDRTTGKAVGPRAASLQGWLDEQDALSSDMSALRKAATSKSPNPSADKYIVGKQYRDAKGNVATYQGNGQWK